MGARDGPAGGKHVGTADGVERGERDEARRQHAEGVGVGVRDLSRAVGIAMMRTPLAWVWLTTFARFLVMGDDYLAQPRGDVRRSAEIATIVTAACRRIRNGVR